MEIKIKGQVATVISDYDPNLNERRSWETTERNSAPSYTMDNRLCDGLSPYSLAEMEILYFQNRLRQNEPYRKAVQQVIKERIYAQQSMTGTEQFDVFANDLTTVFMDYLANTGMLPQVYKINFNITFEDDDEDTWEKPIIDIKLQRDEAEITVEPFINDQDNSIFYVFGGKFNLLITALGYEDVLVQFDTAEDAIKSDILIDVEMTVGVPEEELPEEQEEGLPPVGPESMEPNPELSA